MTKRHDQVNETEAETQPLLRKPAGTLLINEPQKGVTRSSIMRIVLRRVVAGARTEPGWLDSKLSPSTAGNATEEYVPPINRPRRISFPILQRTDEEIDSASIFKAPAIAGSKPVDLIRCGASINLAFPRRITAHTRFNTLSDESKIEV